ncbi:MAG: TonB-dependent receptor [Xanthomonadales bacterium]|nr:TonB-dependent receptor [Xanthomonadales bacterium]
MSAESKTLGLTKYLLALCLSTQVLVAWAQDTDSDADSDADTTTEEEEDDVAALDRVVVTGSLIRREEFTSTSPMQIITAESQFQAGQLSVAEMLQSSTVAAGTTQLNNQFNGFVIQGGTGVRTLDLRGLGAARSLVLLNGRRPGGSGTRGEVNSVDLNNIPEIAVQRFELVLDGSSSIYGSDAVAGVANIITRRTVDDTELTALAEVPLDGGGELYRVGAITGFNTDKGAFTVSAQWDLREALQVGDRDFLNCFEDRVWNEEGQRIDREDRSITAGTPLSGCNNLYTNTILNDLTGQRFIPSPNGVTIGPIPGYRPRVNPNYGPGGTGQAAYEDVLNSDFLESESAINRLERINVYATADYSFDFWGGVDFDADFLYNNRKTEARNWRQFFPTVTSAEFFPYANDPDFTAPFARSRPIMPYPSNTDVEVDFYYFTMGLQGELPTKSYWSWQTYASYSYSDGDYTSNGILASRSGDIFFDDDAPQVDYFSPGILNGTDMQSLIDAIGITETGNTIYDQVQWVGIITGDLMELPAGTVGTAFGLEYRNFSIDDQPPPASQNGDLWGQSSAITTKGSNDVVEAFLEADIPLMSGRAGAENITLNLSIRGFDYKDGGSDLVWKSGLSWQINPILRLRSTVGTSFRAPALFEQYLGNQTGFLGQLAIDPCITWGESTNENIRRNCDAAGIPIDYAGVGSSALVISGGGVDNLEPETSKAFTAGFVFTPEFADITVAADYFDFTVSDQISQLGATSIIGGCYSGENFPNAFCDLFTRAPGSDPAEPYNILEVLDSFVNVNKQRVRGVDLTVVWNHDFNFGTLGVEAQSTWTIENRQQLFDLGQTSGFDETDFAGQIGSPENVANIRSYWNKNDWRVTWFMQYVSETDSKDVANEIFTYFGYPNARRDITMDAVLYHNLSVFYQQDKWDVLLGVNNVLDEAPDLVSTGSGYSTPRGNVPVSASQYDLLGRRIFARVNFRF